MPKATTLYFIDTNIFLRALINDDAIKFNEVISFLEGIKNNHFKAFTSSLILAEVIWTLSSFYKLNKTDVIKAVESIVNLNGLMFIENHDGLEAIDLYKKYNVKYIDCLICTSLRKPKNWVLVSYDKDFDKLKVTRVEPKDII